MDRVSNYNAPELPAPGPAVGQRSENEVLREQVGSYRAESESLRYHIEMLQTQLATIREENSRLRHVFSLECNKHCAATRELSKVQEQFERLQMMLSSKGTEADSIVPLFLHLEARETSLQQVELELGQKISALRATCLNVEERHLGRWQVPVRSANHAQRQQQVQVYRIPVGCRSSVAEQVDKEQQ
ncbi:uncharacterized protein KD926_008963 [Aspergillus affinis]|uniref:uncharacterized protein n=1 Tax=Aspergillus affinis TaxID=1070780 RepID=UPI0022FE102B|nr:uncharacterized protein KD926_008963 [Aspergillus affinis]KAI9039862.1 hypothetical protein KD926_008963 [Aspergillus affinis]